MVLLSLVPNLIINIKTKSATDAIQIRRRESGWFKQTIEYTGYSEVLPWTDADIATKELGAMITDLQNFGDNAIENWKE